MAVNVFQDGTDVIIGASSDAVVVHSDELDTLIEDLQRVKKNSLPDPNQLRLFDDAGRPFPDA